MIDILNQSVEEFCKSYRGPQFHACFCDVPYELNFMGKHWDNSGVAFNPDTWNALAERLLPGAFLFVFAGTLNDDLISVAMRQAGLRKFHKAVLYWGFSSGFPKASNIAVQIDKKNGLIKHRGKAFVTAGCGERKDITGTHGLQDGAYKNPKSKLAKTWAGHRYGLQSLKPAAETILVFTKPYDGKPVDSITKNGSGALNIDDGRIYTNDNMARTNGGKEVLSWGGTYGAGKNDAAKRNEAGLPQLGRWPANLLLSHSPDCNGSCSPECAVRELDNKTGKWIYNKKTEERKFLSASDYFVKADWNYEAAEKIEQAPGVRYCAKASRNERNKMTEEFYWRKNKKSSTGFDRITFAEWKKLEPEDRAEGNIHSTVKPISLTKYLATLLACPPEYAPRRILVPFAGVMSEALGCMLSGHWEEVVAIEKEKDYCNIGKARVKYWQIHRKIVEAV